MTGCHLYGYADPTVLVGDEKYMWLTLPLFPPSPPPRARRSIFGFRYRQDDTDEGKLVALSDADKDQLRDEVASLRKRYPKGKHKI